jgi:hypothetical protein
VLSVVGGLLPLGMLIFIVHREEVGFSGAVAPEDGDVNLL